MTCAGVVTYRWCVCRYLWAPRLRHVSIRYRDPLESTPIVTASDNTFSTSPAPEVELPSPVPVAEVSVKSHPVTLSADDVFGAQVGHRVGSSRLCSVIMQNVSQPNMHDTMQELFTELQDSQQFGKRGEVWLFAQIATVLLVLFPPFGLKVCQGQPICMVHTVNISSGWLSAPGCHATNNVSQVTVA